MPRLPVSPINPGDPMTLFAEDQPLRIPLYQDPETKAILRLTVQPLGWPGTMGKAGFFEAHSCDEEVYMIRGSLDFQGYYTLRAGDYANHPPHWVHPSGQIASTDEPAVFLMRHSEAVDFFYDPIPEPFEEEFFARPFDGPRGAGVTRLPVDSVAWQPLTLEGEATGTECKVLWHNPRDGWTTWMQRFPAGWQGSGEPQVDRQAGDELYLLSGDLTVVVRGEAASLTAGAYYCSPEELWYPGSAGRAAGGAVALRWTRYARRYDLPAPVTGA